jgi:hypothetical protein
MSKIERAEETPPSLLKGNIMNSLFKDHPRILTRKIFILTSNPPEAPSPSSSDKEELREVVRSMKEAHNDPQRYLMIKLFDNSFIDDFLRMLPPGAAPTFRPLCEILMSDVETLCLKEKFRHRRARPAQMAKAEGFDLGEFDSDTDESPAYPSGHAAGSRILALALGEIFPHRKEVLVELSRLIGQSRIDGGLHYPSDVQAGFEWAEELWASSRRSGLRIKDHVERNKIDRADKKETSLT